MRNFRNYDIWKDGITLCKLVYKLIETFPKIERFNLTSQIMHSTCSVPSNIAEGTSRSSQKELNHYLEISLGSLFELETQLIICLEFGYISLEQFHSIEEPIQSLQKRISGFISTINKKE
ncbi:MAG: four helix bundle protein [Saprospiraceae bacterium]|nr:four helix bundle protein [Saprospiraceae bacterium]